MLDAGVAGRGALLLDLSEQSERAGPVAAKLVRHAQQTLELEPRFMVVRQEGGRAGEQFGRLAPVDAFEGARACGAEPASGLAGEHWIRVAARRSEESRTFQVVADGLVQLGPATVDRARD